MNISFNCCIVQQQQLLNLIKLCSCLQLLQMNSYYCYYFYWYQLQLLSLHEKNLVSETSAYLCNLTISTFIFAMMIMAIIVVDFFLQHLTTINYGNLVYLYCIDGSQIFFGYSWRYLIVLKILKGYHFLLFLICNFFRGLFDALPYLLLPLQQKFRLLLSIPIAYILVVKTISY